MSWPKQDGGSEPSSPILGPLRRTLLPPSPIYVDNKRPAQALEECTTNFSPRSVDRCVSPKSKLLFVTDTGSPVGRAPPESTSGRSTPQYPELGSSSDQSQCDEIHQPTGIKLDNKLNWEIWTRSPQTYMYVIIGPSLPLLQIMLNRLQLSGVAPFFGEPPVLEKVSEHGQRRVYRLILKTHDQSGGADTRIKFTLYSMSFVEELTWHTCYDGSTVIQSAWKLKGLPGPCWHPRYGLPLTWIHGPGTPI